MTQIISLDKIREAKKAQKEEPEYQARIAQMDKLELLDEMVRFQEERSAAGGLNIRLMTHGQHLFKLLEARAETGELRELARTYGKHLQLELKAYFKSENQRRAPRPAKKG